MMKPTPNERAMAIARLVVILKREQAAGNPNPILVRWLGELLARERYS